VVTVAIVLLVSCTTAPVTDRKQLALIRDDESVNAFAMPGGKIAVYTGILPIAQDEQGLAVIMGHEEEADTIGLILTARAGYDPRSAIPFWQRMADEGGARPPEFLSTHPNPESRIKNLRDQMPRALEYY